MVCVLGPSVEFNTVASPLPLREEVPRFVEVAVSEKLTLPDGVPTPNFFVTVAVYVTVSPKAEGLSEEDSAVDVGVVLVLIKTPTGPFVRTSSLPSPFKSA